MEKEEEVMMICIFNSFLEFKNSGEYYRKGNHGISLSYINFLLDKGIITKDPGKDSVELTIENFKIDEKSRKLWNCYDMIECTRCTSSFKLKYCSDVHFSRKSDYCKKSKNLTDEKGVEGNFENNRSSKYTKKYKNSPKRKHRRR